MIVYENEYFTLIEETDVLKINTKKIGFDIKELNQITLDNPAFHITNFPALKEALQVFKDKAITIGLIKPIIDIHISKNKMEACIILNVTAKEFEENKIAYYPKIVEILESNNIVYGMEDIYNKPLSVQKEIIVAKGTLPTDGANSQIKMYEIKDKEPKIEEDGKVNYYEVSLIESVSKGDWVGEMTPPTDGIPGTTVTGEIIDAKPGKTKKLLYDVKTVAIYEEDGIKVLRSLVDGAIRIDNGKVKIDNLLVIKGDVDYVTGNVHFAGSVVIQGTVQDNFSVIANGDISINGSFGLGSVNRIESIYGSIYIKGGIFGKHISKIKAEKDVFLKYCNETEVLARGNINIGFYSLSSTLTAQNIFLNPTHGRIIGGNVYAEARVVTSCVGNKTEKLTFINITGFNRLKVTNTLNELAEKYKKLRQDTAHIRVRLDTLEMNLVGTNIMDNKEYVKSKELYEIFIRELIKMEGDQKQMIKILSTKGEGELDVSKTIYPKTHLLIKQFLKVFEEPTAGVIYIANGELVHEEN